MLLLFFNFSKWRVLKRIWNVFSCSPRETRQCCCYDTQSIHFSCYLVWLLPIAKRRGNNAKEGGGGVIRNRIIHKSLKPHDTAIYRWTSLSGEGQMSCTGTLLFFGNQNLWECRDRQGGERGTGHARYAESDRGSITNDDIRDDRPQRIFTRHSYFTGTGMPHVSHTLSCWQIHCTLQSWPSLLNVNTCAFNFNAWTTQK